MKISGTNMQMIRGDSESIKVTLSGYEPQPGDYVELTVRKTPTSSPVIYKRETFGEEASVVFSISPEDTESLKFGDYVYDVQLTFNGTIKTVVGPSSFVIGEEVTYGSEY